ncbi:nitrate reductase associated protein [Burkholderia glumae]|uniref:nitrate reductase associated protein n=1 Tax=Burkholderia glumae TaxID=337 RepID=UPI002036A9DA|nr:nitrate reductase associated protein [Burkholderia glumae]MCM2491176.1 nitrate reductase associated protein [Burkholderia glumae]MCM2542169.1 nitrate reductase associated protein [Burkholderia glumae]
MELSHQPRLFDFEVESSEDFTFIPMIVRFHLDRCALRISLDQWQRLPLEDRRLLARFPVVDEAHEPDAARPDVARPDFARALADMLRAHAAGEAERIVPEAAPAWREPAVVPAALAAQCALAGLSVPDAAAWAALGPFERYALAKLSRKPKLNHDFLPAMREFGLAPR